MKIVVTPNIDIVLSNGMFLRRGVKSEVEVSESDYSFISPYVVEETIQTDDKVTIEKPKRGRKPAVVKNELD